MERPLPEDEDGADNDMEYTNGSYNGLDSRNNGQMPSNEEREEEEGRKVGGFGREFIIPGVVPLSQGGEGAQVERGHCVGGGGQRLNNDLVFLRQLLIR